MGWAEEESPKERGREGGGNPEKPWSVLLASGSTSWFTLSFSHHAHEHARATAVETLKPQPGESKHPSLGRDETSAPCSSARWLSRFLDPSLCSSASESGTPSSRESLVTSWALQLVIFLELGRAVVLHLSMPLTFVHSMHVLLLTSPPNEAVRTVQLETQSLLLVCYFPSVPTLFLKCQTLLECAFETCLYVKAIPFLFKNR